MSPPPPGTDVEHQGDRSAEHQRAQPHQHETGVAQLAARPEQTGATCPRVADEAEPGKEHERERAEQPAQQGDGGEHAEPQRVERRLDVRQLLTHHLPRVAAHRGAPVAVEMRERHNGGQAWTAQNGAHWWLSSALTVATCTQHWVSRSSIIVFMSMKGFTVTRRTRSPSILRSRWCRPGSRDDASMARVPIPRSQFWQMSSQIEDIDGCDNDDCSLIRSSSEPFTTARSRRVVASSAIWFASAAGWSASHCLSRS